ncbi:MAG: hypothetical protein MAG458_01721 [Nitrosopumilus sp.]|nr:hypothetical protein [Nitrosopumilus sp.]
MVEFDIYEIAILRKMHSYDYIGARHTSVDNLQRGFPSHVRGDVKKFVKRLIKLNLIILKSSTKEMHCSLNKSKIKEIEEIIQ